MSSTLTTPKMSSKKNALKKKPTKAPKPVKVKKEKTVAPTKKTKKSEVVPVEEVVAPVEVEVPSTEHKTKTINMKETNSDVVGLNLSIPKIKNIISNYSINAEIFSLLGEVDETFSSFEGKSAAFTWKAFSKDTRAALTMWHQLYEREEMRTFTSTVLKSFDKKKESKYHDMKKESKTAWNATRQRVSLMDNLEFDLIAFNLEFDVNFYKDFPSVDLTSLSGEELQTTLKTMLSKQKVRFNSESKLFIAAFVEYVVRQMITHATWNCVESGKKNIKLSHALDMSSETLTDRFPLWVLVSRLNAVAEAKQFLSDISAFKELKDSMKGSEEEFTETEPVLKPIDLGAGSKYQFKHHINELCRSVRMELGSADSSVKVPEDSVYNHTTVSKNFKLFCSNVVLELLFNMGSALKLEVESRNVKTINYNIVRSLVKLYHIMFNLESSLPQTSAFIHSASLTHLEYLANKESSEEE